LPSTQSSGQVELPLDLAKQMDTIHRGLGVLDRHQINVMLGDVQDAFHLEAFSLKDISDLTALGMQNLNLDDLGLTRWQTPSSLVKAIPELGSLNLSQVQPLEDLAKNGYAYGDSAISDLLGRIRSLLIRHWRN
jgi:hypothetical protein